jgi:Tfp pilus assembly protein PilF
MSRAGALAERCLSSRVKDPQVDRVTLELKAGLEKHQRGDLAGAEQVYRTILEANPEHGGAWHLLGLIHLAKRKYQQAKSEIERALALCDSKADYWNNYGAVLRELRSTEEAKAAFERSLAIAPRYADALSNLGRACASWEMQMRRITS